MDNELNTKLQTDKNLENEKSNIIDIDQSSLDNPVSKLQQQYENLIREYNLKFPFNQYPNKRPERQRSILRSVLNYTSNSATSQNPYSS